MIVRALFVALMGLAVACGGSTENKPPPTDGDQVEPPQPPSKDEIFEYEAESLEGMRFQPQALGVPGMWKISTPKRATLKKQRKIAKRKSAKVTDFQVLAALAWTESGELLGKARKEPDDAKKAKLDEQANKLRVEALEALRKAYELAGEGKADEITLKLLSVAELTVGEEPKAVKVYEEIVKRFPGKEGPTNGKVWLTNLYLRADRLADAAKIVEGWKLTDDFDAMGAYVLAWVKFRQRDYDTARKGILHAALNWKGAAGRRAVSTEVLLFLSRTGTPVAEGKAAIEKVVGPESTNEQYQWLYNLSKGYEFSGYPRLALETLELLLSGSVVAEVPVRDQVVFRAEMAYDALKAGDPGKTASAAIEAHKKLAECGDTCAKSAANVTQSIQTYATLLHTLYAHSLDESYYAPAKQLYDYYLAIPGVENGEVIKGYASRLADTKANANPEQGKHDKVETQKLLKLRLNAIKACYEAVLQGEPELAGEVVLTLNIADTGEVSGVETKPAAGKAGLAAVGGCLQERSKTFKFPGRTLKGTTALVQPFKFSPAKPQG
jgi:hypothetical protein